MAVKPTDTVPDWPSNATFTAGPSIGQPTTIDPTPFAGNGHIEGLSNPTDCRVQNGWQKRAGAWCRWVEAGSSAGAADAHIVETTALGETSVRSLNILGSGGISGPALEVTRNSTPYEAASITTPGVSTVLIGGDNYAMQISSSGGGLTIGATGDTIPLTLFPQTTRPSTFTGNDGGIYLEKVVQAGDDAFAMRVIANNQRLAIPIYRDQYVHAYQDDAGTPTVFNGDISSSTSILQAPMDFYSSIGPLDANIAMMYDITFEASIASAPADFRIEFQNNGSTIRAFNVHLPSTTVQQIHLRGSYLTGASSLNANSFDVRASKYVGGGSNITIANAIATIETVR